jgi:hypothetical protein
MMDTNPSEAVRKLGADDVDIRISIGLSQKCFLSLIQLTHVAQNPSLAHQNIPLREKLSLS